VGRPLWLGDTKRLVSTEQRIVLHSAKRRYLGKLSGPLLDRVDLRVQMYRVGTAALGTEARECTQVVRERVARARAASADRWRPHGVLTNAEVPGPLLRERYRLAREAMDPLRRALDRGVVSIRGMDRTLRVARELADFAPVGQSVFCPRAGSYVQVARGVYVAGSFSLGGG
jgi:predicted ATPase with chaperone activity